MEPAGISSAFSCTLSICQSTNAHCVKFKWNSPLAHCGFLHTCGSVYWNCCSTDGCTVPHFVQVKAP